jgi:hypothetical protein
MRHRIKKLGLGGAELRLRGDGGAGRGPSNADRIAAGEVPIKWGIHIIGWEGDSNNSTLANNLGAKQKSSSATKGGTHDEGSETPIYRPPQLGNMEYGSSYSYIETLDLLSDGPIEGLVNENGQVCEGAALLQGIYFDDTAVAVTSNTFDDRGENSLQSNVTNTSPVAVVGEITGSFGVITGFFGALTTGVGTDLNVKPSGQSGIITLNEAGVPAIQFDHATTAPNWGDDDDTPWPAWTSGDALWRDLDISEGSQNTICAHHWIRNGYRRTSEVTNRFGYGSLRGTSITVRNPIGSVNSGTRAEHVGAPHPYGCFVGVNDESTDNGDATLCYLPPSGDQKAQILPALDGPRQGFRDNYHRWATRQDYLLYSDVTGAKQLRSASDPRRPYEQGTDDYNFIFSLGTRNAGPLIWDVKMQHWDGRRLNRNADKPNPRVPGVLARGYSRMGWFGNRHNTAGVNSKGWDGGSANKLATILLREFTEKIIPLYLDNLSQEGKLSGSLYQAKLAKQTLQKFFPLSNSVSWPTSAGGDSLSNPDDVISRLRSFLNRIGGHGTDHHHCMMVFRPPQDQTGLTGLLAIDPNEEWGSHGNFKYKKLQNYGFRLKTTQGEDLNSIASQVQNQLKVFDFLVPHIDKGGTLTGKVDGFILVTWQANEGEILLERENGKTYRGEIDTEGHAPSFTDAYNARFGAATNGFSSRQFTTKDNKGETVTHANGIAGLLSRINSCVYADAEGRVVGSQDFETAVSRWEEGTARVRGDNQKYNYSNVLAEIKHGEEGQAPFRFFNHVEIDTVYNAKLFGPFRRGPVQRIREGRKMLDPKGFGKTKNVDDEGSDDVRTVDGEKLNYSDWARGMTPNFSEPATPIVHTIHNPNVESVYVTLGINVLKDTLHVEAEPDELKKNKEEDARKLSPASTYPALLAVRIKVGMINPIDGTKTMEAYRDFKFVALINGRTIVDLGNPQTTKSDYPWVRHSWNNLYNDLIDKPIPLPPASPRVDGHGIAGDGDENEILNHRYIEIEKRSCETNSVLLHRDVDLHKVTEIIPVNLTYPFSAVVGTKIDSRSIESPPARTFDCKLKKVKLPNNYKPIGPNGYDKRYWNSRKEFNEADSELKRVYQGDWDGGFHEVLMWTDNPAWILYDLLTSKRYGLGQHIEEATINKWQLYRIARFCDAVNDEGFFEGCSDGHGGLEPRFTCNLVFDQGERIYDAINTIVSLFRGSVFFGSNEVSFVDDRPRSPVNLLTNESVKDGQFAYSNNSRDEIFNTIEITYNDRFENFLPKVEVVENEEDIKDRGTFMTRIDGVGLTSKAMARRAGLHHMMHKIVENQTVAFTASLPTLLCQPGDLVIIEDELKTNIQNFGKILHVNPSAQEIRVSNTFIDSTMTGRLTVYDPTGVDTINEVATTAEQLRRRKYIPFEITGNLTPIDAGSLPFPQYYTGSYAFSGYTEGYSLTEIGSSTVPFMEQYALYTGESTNLIHFDTDATGWVFSTGAPFNTGFYTFISPEKTNSVASLVDLVDATINVFDGNDADRRGTSYSTQGAFSGSRSDMNEAWTRGILPEEINVVSPAQTTVINLTGSPNPILQDYGTLISGVQETDVLSRLKVGSPCKFEIKNASPSIYKILDIKEEAPNEYIVTASKYETGKYNLIENSKSIEHLPNTFSYQLGQTINGVTYQSLAAPTGLSAVTGYNETSGYYIDASWFNDASNGSSATGYLAVLNGPSQMETIIETGATTCTFTLLETVGMYAFRVKALGNRGTDGFNQDAYYDSQFAQIPVTLIPQLDNALIGRSMVENFTINNDV